MVAVFCCVSVAQAEADDSELLIKQCRDACAQSRATNQKLRVATEKLVSLIKGKVLHGALIDFENSSYSFLDSILNIVNESDELLKFLPKKREEKIDTLITLYKRLKIVASAHHKISVVHIFILEVAMEQPEQLNKFLYKKFEI